MCKLSLACSTCEVAVVSVWLEMRCLGTFPVMAVATVLALTHEVPSGQGKVPVHVVKAVLGFSCKLSNGSSTTTV